MLRKTQLGRAAEIIALIALTLLAFARGSAALGHKSLWWDESLSLHRAHQDLVSILSGRIVLTDNLESVVTSDDHPPLYFLLLQLAVLAWGQSEFALRFLSLAAVVAITPLLCATGRRLVNRPAGLAAAGLGALSPMYLWYGQEARMYALLTFLCLLSFYSFVRAFLGAQGPLASRDQRVWLVVYAISVFCVMLTHYLGALVIAYELAVLAFLFLRQKKTRWLVLGAAMIGSVVLLGALVYATSNLPNMLNPGESRPGFAFVPLLGLLRDLLNSYSLGLSVNVEHWYVLSVDLVVLLLAVMGLVRLVRPGASQGRKIAGWLVAGYLLLPIAAIYLFSYVKPAYMNSRHLMAISPAFYLLVAAGLTWLRGRVAAAGVLSSLVLVGGVSYSTHNYFYDPAYDKDHHREWGEYLRQHVRSGDVVVVDPPHIAELYDYYAESGVPWIGLPLLRKTAAETEATLEGLLEQYDRVWLALSYTPPWGDPDLLPESWLNQHAFRVDYHEFASYASRVLVANYLPGLPSVRRLPDDVQAVGVRYSAALQLLGYRSVSQPEPGKRLHVQIFWSVDQPIPHEASVSLRLVDGNGHVWGQGDQCPFNGLFPMWQWSPGQILRDEQELLIQPGTPPGEYQLEAVLVSRPTSDGCWGPAGAVVPPLEGPAQNRRGDRVLLGPVTLGRSLTTPADADLSIGQRRAVRFGGLELVGTSFPATVLKPGERLEMSLFWRARRATLGDLQFRLRVVDSAGNAWQDRTIRPVGDAYPADQWLAGDRFQGQFWLSVPEDALDGEYQVELIPEPPLQRNGLWTGLRRWLGVAGNPLRLGRVEVRAEKATTPRVPITPIPPPQTLQVAEPMLATLGNQVRFLGWDLASDSLRAGETLSVTLYWQGLRAMDTSYTVFAHLVDASGVVVAQQDNPPRLGTYPTTFWNPGEVVTDTYRIPVSRNTLPGTYALEVGMYRLETLGRLPVANAEGRLLGDRLELATIELQPEPRRPYRAYLPCIEVRR